MAMLQYINQTAAGINVYDQWNGMPLHYCPIFLKVTVMFLMMGINSMLSNNRKIVILFTILLLNIISINCYAQSPVVSCPATFSDKHAVYRLFNAKLFNGPLSERVSLVTEFKNKKLYGILTREWTLI
jgi:hypothetical protein